jgi:hypothetical protein
VGNYLSIPDVVDSEEIVALQSGADLRKWELTLPVDALSTRLFHAATNGERFPLVVLTTDSQILALDEVYVAQAWMSGAPNEFVHVELDAQEVRFT